MKPDPTNAERQRRWYWNHREHKLSLTRDRYYAAKKAGMCVKCQTKPAIHGRVRCQDCREARRKP